MGNRIEVTFARLAYNTLRLLAKFTLATFDPADDCPSRGRKPGRGRPLSGFVAVHSHHPYANTRPLCFPALAAHPAQNAA